MEPAVSNPGQTSQTRSLPPDSPVQPNTILQPVSQDLAVSPNKPAEPVKDDKYAQSLLSALDAQMQMEQIRVPKKKFLSTKKMIYIGVSIVLTIASIILAPSLLKSGTGAINTDQATQQQILNSAGQAPGLGK